jgi:hypothetical protein
MDNIEKSSIKNIEETIKETTGETTEEIIKETKEEVTEETKKTTEETKETTEETTKLQYLENYKSVLYQLIEDLHLTFTDDGSITRCNEQKEHISCEKHYKYFLRKIEPHVQKLHNNDSALFLEEKLYLIPTINFSKLWKSNISENTQNTIWKYLQTLYLIASRIENINNDEDMIKKMIKNITKEDGIKDFHNKMSQLNEDDIKNTSEKIENVLKNDKDPNSKMIFEMIDDLSKEIMDSNNNMPNEKEMMDSLMSGNMEGMSGIMNVANKVVSSLQTKIESGKINPQKMAETAQNMMSNLQNNTDLPFSNLMNMAGNMQNMGLNR